MSVRTIEVSFNKKERIVTSEWICEADPGDVIHWYSAFPFVIHFDRISPLGSMIFHSKEKGKRFIVEAPVVFNTSERGARKFSYYLAAFQGRAMDIVDPEIIIPRGPGR